MHIMKHKNTSVGGFIVAIILLALLIFFSVCGSLAGADLPKQDSLTATYTAEGDAIKLYVIIDPDSGIEYLVSDHGGITPRVRDLDWKGGMGSAVYEYYEYW